MNERQLPDVAMTQPLWADATIEMLTEEGGEAISPDEQAGFYGDAIADAVTLGQMSVKDLRQWRSELNALDREATERAGGDIEAFKDSGDYLEATARRLGHQATDAALQQVKSKDLRRRRVRENGQRLQLSEEHGYYRTTIGLGRPEWHPHDEEDRYLLP